MKITWRHLHFSPISTNEDNTSDHEYLCSIDPELITSTIQKPNVGQISFSYFKILYCFLNIIK